MDLILDSPGRNYNSVLLFAQLNSAAASAADRAAADCYRQQ